MKLKRCINRAEIRGHVGKDPELRHFENSRKASFSIAVNKSYKQGDEWKTTETQWINIEAWGDTADAVVDEINKGDHVQVEGELVTNQWERDGHRFEKTAIKIWEFIKLPGKAKPANDSLPAVEEADVPF